MAQPVLIGSDMKTTNRYQVASTLSAPSTIALTVGESYYMGASMSPDLVTVTALTDSMIEYELSGRTLRVQRWIGEDLIATGCRTMREILRNLLATAMGQKMDRSGGVTTKLARLDAILA